MQDNVKELKQCTRCHSTILLKYFDTNRKGEYYKTCRNCLTRDRKTEHEYYEDNKDKILEKNKDDVFKFMAIGACSFVVI